MLFILGTNCEIHMKYFLTLKSSNAKFAVYYNDKTIIQLWDGNKMLGKELKDTNVDELYAFVSQVTDVQPSIYHYCRPLVIEKQLLNKGIGLGLPCYVMNTRNEYVRFQRMKKEIPDLIRIECDVFDQSMNTEQRYQQLTSNHLKTIRTVLHENHYNGAVFLEDDVTLLDGWQDYLWGIIQAVPVECVNLNNFYYDYSDSNEIYLHKALGRFSCAAYYLSMNGMKKIVAQNQYISYKNTQIENILHNTFESVYTTTPRLALQQWNLYKTSNIQPDKQMKLYIEMLETIYLPRYESKYPFYVSTKNK